MKKFTGMDTLATTRVLTQEQKSILLRQSETDLKQQFPRSAAIQRVPLTLVEGDALKSKLNVYVRKHLMKGVPSLALDLQSLAVRTRWTVHTCFGSGGLSESCNNEYAP
jgi:hypothetical protein